MNFLDNVVKSSNSLLKDKITNSLAGLEQMKIGETFSNLVANVDEKFHNLTLPKNATIATDAKDKSIQNSPADLPNDTQSKTACSDKIDEDKTGSGENHSQKLGHQKSLEADDLSTTEQPAQNFNEQLAAIAADAQSVGLKTVVGAKQLGNLLFSYGLKASQTVSVTATKVKEAVESSSIVSDFAREQQEFKKLQAEKSPQQTDVEHSKADSCKPSENERQFLPWAQFDGDDQKEIRDELRKQILSLSQYKQCFTQRSDDFRQIDLNLCYATAMQILIEDPRLEKLRFKLVPKVISEDSFWQNYFSRVNALTSYAEKSALSELRSYIGSLNYTKIEDDDDELVQAKKQRVCNAEGNSISSDLANISEQWDKESLNEYEIVSAISDEELDEAILDDDIAEFERQTKTK